MRVYIIDPFLALIDACLVGVSPESLFSLLAPLAPEKVLGSAFNPTVNSIFYALDEAQVAGKQYMGTFADTNGKARNTGGSLNWPMKDLPAVNHGPF